MKLRSGYLEQSEFNEAINDHKETRFKSQLKCFTDHNGFRSGEIHAFIAPKGGGKSTLSRTIVSELLYSDHNILLYLSEEEAQKYLMEINSNVRQIYGADHERATKILDKLKVVSELDLKITNEDQWLRDIKFIIEEECIDIIVLDNFTTSFLGELFVSKQSQILRNLKKLAAKQDVPILIFFHTAKGAAQKLFGGDDVRGSATAVNLGSYNYILFYFRSINECFLWTEKSRYHRRANGQVYQLQFDGRAGIFIDAKVSNMDGLKDASKRNA